MPIANAALASRLAEQLRAAWQGLRKRQPIERFYAIGFYTTPDADYMMPFACGKEGLLQVSQQYVNNKH